MERGGSRIKVKILFFFCRLFVRYLPSSYMMVNFDNDIWPDLMTGTMYQWYIYDVQNIHGFEIGFEK